MAMHDAPQPEAHPETAEQSTAAVIQEVINAMVRDGGQDRTPDEHAAALEAELGSRGLPEQPQPWVRAVAEAASRGDAYVMDARTARSEDVPEPETMTRVRGIT